MGAEQMLQAYLAPDRRQAIAQGVELATTSQGAVLWADLSGFTALGERLVRQRGERRGAEELGLQLNRFYDALIAPLEQYGGSVVSFSGDAITCWFAGDDGRWAVAAAQAMRVAMQALAEVQLSPDESLRLGIKTAVASGPVRRYRVGDPAVQYLDTLAGATLDRLGEVGHLARTGELLVDEATAGRLERLVKIKVWRKHAETGRRAAVLAGLSEAVDPPAPAGIQAAVLSEAQVRPWLLPAVHARLRDGDGEFLTELRPAVALFMRFEGLEYADDEQAGEELDGIIRGVQGILDAYEGTLLQLTIGDKGSYVYAAFGAPVAHEDDTVRALAAALELRKLPLQGVGIGLSRGVMRTGAYGGATRRTYGVLGDEVNLAARLMEQAAVGQVLASESIWQATGEEYEWKRLPSLKVKGRGAAVKPAVLLAREVREMGWHRPALPMVGRRAELAQVREKLELARQGRGQVVSIIGEAGMGKSRLLAEVLEQADDLLIYTGECQSYGTQSSYLVWQSIWRALFGIDPAVSVNRQIETLEKALELIDPELVPRLPLLGAVLNLNIAENELTRGLDARARKNSREALLLDCLRAKAAGHALVLVLEDVHWIDPLSRDLLELIGRVIEQVPVLVLLAYRPEAKAMLPRLGALEYATDVRLVELTREETEELIAARLGYFELEGVMQQLLARAQGNPFYIEELLNYMRDRRLDPREQRAWEQAALPDSLQSLILSRIDQLSEHQQITLKAASIIGRLFRAGWLYEYYPPLGGSERVRASLDGLDRLELIKRETPEPQLAYLFKHVITQEVAYESLAYATRAGLHEQFARYLERAVGEQVDAYLDLLAYHYERSDNLKKKREYLRRAGEAAGKVYANETALSYLGRALALAPETDYADRFAILMVMERVHDLLGRREQQDQDLTALAALADALDDDGMRAQTALNRANFFQRTSRYEAGITAAQHAIDAAQRAGAAEQEARGYMAMAWVLIGQSRFSEARQQGERALALAQTAALTGLTSASLDLLGNLETYADNYEDARIHLGRALDLDRAAGNRRAEAKDLYNLGETVYILGDLALAQDYYERALLVNRTIGDRPAEAMTLTRLGNLITEQRGDYLLAKRHCEQSLRLIRETGDRRDTASTLYSLGNIELLRNNYVQARVYSEEAFRICVEIGRNEAQAACLDQLGSIADALGEYELALKYDQQGHTLIRKIGEKRGEAIFLKDMGISYFHLGQYPTALERSEQGLAIQKEINDKVGQARGLAVCGHILVGMGDLDRAADSYRQVLDLAVEAHLQRHLTIQARTGLAGIALARGNMTAALASMEEILGYLQTLPLSTVDEVFWIYLTCYHIQQVAADPRARATLEAAYRLLHSIAQGIEDDVLRVTFLQNVRANRQIAQAWEGLTSSGG